MQILTANGRFLFHSSLITVNGIWKTLRLFRHGSLLPVSSATTTFSARDSSATNATTVRTTCYDQGADLLSASANPARVRTTTVVDPSSNLLSAAATSYPSCRHPSIDDKASRLLSTTYSTTNNDQGSCVLSTSVTCPTSTDFRSSHLLSTGH